MPVERDISLPLESRMQKIVLILPVFKSG